MENTARDIEELRLKFKECGAFLSAIGDETRQYLIYIMLSSKCSGNRVVDLALKTNLSRPAVSHHMQILKKAGIVKARKEATRIYYYLDPSEGEVDKMLGLLNDIKRITENLPDRSGNE